MPRNPRRGRLFQLFSGPANQYLSNSKVMSIPGIETHGATDTLDLGTGVEMDGDEIEGDEPETRLV